jgi:hypothetical protein
VAAHGTATALITVYTGSDCATVQNAVRIKASASAGRPAGGSGWAGSTGISLAALGGAGLLLGLRRRRFARWMAALIAVSVIGILSGCGGSSGSTSTTTPPGAATGTYTLTVTGTDAVSNTNTATATFTLIVQ